MKRLSVLFCTVFALVFFTSFSGPEKLLAVEGDLTQITQTDYETLKLVAQDINSQIEYSGTIVTNSILARKYLDILERVYDTTKSIPNTTKSSLEVQVLNEYIVYLNERIASGETTEKADAEKVLILARQRFNNAVARVQFENGVITSSERTSLINASSNEASQAIAKRTENPSACSLINGNLIECADYLVASIIKNTLLQLAGVFVWLTAELLNLAIKLGILGFKDWAPDTLYGTWIVVRQIISLAVVFAGLYLGFMYIIGREQTFTRYVGWLVIFALFVNFSYPITRMLADVSNIISLNIYTAAVGPEVITGNVTGNSAGRLVMNRLGLDGLVISLTKVPDGQNSKLSDLNSTPNALLAVVFVFYAAYIFFMAAWILIFRTIVLVFLTIASPLLLVDSVIPKLGEAAARMRKMFFEQLTVAPVFMIMFALTMKFIEVFQTSGPLSGSSSLVAGSSPTVATFFSLLMMLAMLHITLRVTRDVSGAAGKFATDAMGKVGGFGLGLASGGAGLLARGTIGAGAARWRESDWMKNKQDTRLGRGLYTLSNSLAQSTFDTRNIGMVSSTMQKAGLTSIGGVGMQKGIVQNYDERFKAKNEASKKREAYISSADNKKSGVRERFLEQQTNTIGSVAQKAFLGTIGRATGLRGNELRSDAEIIRDKRKTERESILKRYNSFKDEDRKRAFLEAQSDDIKEYLRNSSSSAEAVEVSQTSTSAQGQTKKPNLDTTELDKAGFYPPNRGGPGDGGSGAAVTAPQKPGPANGPAGATAPQGHDDTIETVANGFGFKGTVYPTYAEAVSARRVYKQTKAAGATNTSTSSQTPPPEPPTSSAPSPKGTSPSPSPAPTNNNETATT